MISIKLKLKRTLDLVNDCNSFKIKRLKKFMQLFDRTLQDFFWNVIIEIGLKNDIEIFAFA